MDFLIALAALCFLMFVAYRGFSVILFAPIAALGAVFLTDPHAVPAAFTSLFMEKMVAYAKLYFPVFLLGAVFGKAIELSGFAKSIVATIMHFVSKERAMSFQLALAPLLSSRQNGRQDRPQSAEEGDPMVFLIALAALFKSRYCGLRPQQ